MNEQKTLREVMDLSGKVAVVTGGAMGIGYGISYRLAEAGAKTIIADINTEAGERAVRALTDKGFSADFFLLNVADEENVKAAVAFAKEKHGGLDVWVNNAGIYPNVPAMQMESSLFDKIISVNLRGVFLCTKAAAALMIEQGRGGSIININSIDALHPSSVGLAAYDASKHGAWGFTKNVALELSGHNIRVNAIAPGGIATPGTGAGQPAPKEIEEIVKKFLQKIPMKRMGDPDEIGKVALFLASDLSSYMTGSQIVVDGGVLLS